MLHTLISRRNNNFSKYLPHSSWFRWWWAIWIDSTAASDSEYAMARNAVYARGSTTLRSAHSPHCFTRDRLGTLLAMFDDWQFLGPDTACIVISQRHACFESWMLVIMAHDYTFMNAQFRCWSIRSRLPPRLNYRYRSFISLRRQLNI